MPVEIKYDIKRGADTYRAIYGSRLKNWITTGLIRADDVLVRRSGLSGWRRPEELEELASFFERREKQLLRKIKAPEERFFLKKKKKKKKIKNILIIDDEKDLCSLLSDALSQRRYNVTTANTKREGVASLKREMPDLVFLDLKLPDDDGMTLLPKIREINSRAIVNIISAYGTEEKREEAARQGAHGFIDKPFDEKDILKSIRAVS